jgi:MEMO1 family protein
MDFPKLRPINVFPVRMSDETLICLQDPDNISEKALFFSPHAYYVLTLFDGQHSALDIQAEYMRQFGVFLYAEKLQEIVDQLDEHLYLENERFQEALGRIEERFQKAPVREAVFAGKSYEAHPDGLRIRLNHYFEQEGGPGPVGQRAAKSGLRGAIAPHIDLQRGGGCYAFAHREIGIRNDAYCFVILGVAHTGMKHPFSLTRKAFETPLGKLDVDQELVEAIQSRCPYDLFRDEGVHRNEHSVEFQCLFLRYLYPEPASIRIVPVLCGSFHEAIGQSVSPMELNPFRQFVDALSESVFARGEKIFYLASADLAHMGLQFGDREAVGEADLSVLEEADREMLGYVETMDGEGFYSSILRERDRRKICGLPAIYTLLKVMEAKEGKLLNYRQAYTPETHSVVSFASLGFYE